MHTNIKTIDENVEHWPNKPMKKCTLLTVVDNKFHEYQADLLPEEVELVMELRYLEADGRISQKEFDSLVKKIDAYGDARYGEGTDDETISNAESEL